MLEELDAPASLMDATGTVVWQNAAATAFVGDKRGATLPAIASDYQEQSRAAFARRAKGADRIATGGVVLVDAEGNRKRVETVSLTLMNGATFVGVLGFVRSVSTAPAEPVRQPLTPRLHETLVLLAAGSSTAEIAERLGVAQETARNYIRRLLRSLGVHSRLEAVVRARDTGII